MSYSAISVVFSLTSASTSIIIKIIIARALVELDALTTFILIVPNETFFAIVR